MAPMNHGPPAIAADFNIIQNRVAVALAKRERLIKSWTASSSRPRPQPKSQDELNAEEAELFRVEPPHLGLGAPIPKDYQKSDISRRELAGKRSLSQVLLGKRSGLQGSKPRDLQEKASSTKRGLKEDSSDEEEGRSGLGRVKKSKTTSSSSTTGKTSIPESQKTEIDAHESVVSVKPRIESLGHVHPLEQRNDWLQEHTSTAKHLYTIKSPLVTCVNEYGEDNNNASVGSKQAIAPKQCILSDSDAKRDWYTKKTTRAGVSNLVSNGTVDSEFTIYDNGPSSDTLPTIEFRSNSKDSSSPSITSASGDSDPSDMDIAIPTPLTTDVITKTTDTPVSNTSLTAAEQLRKQRNREKKVKRKERRRREKVAARLTSANEAAVKTQASLGGAQGKKLKDRLLDANGN